MVKIIGESGAASLGFSPNTLSAFHEALESADGLSTHLSISSDGELFCVKDITRQGSRISYDIKSHLDDKSIELLGERQLKDCMAKEIESFRTKNGAQIPNLESLLNIFKNYHHKTLILHTRGENSPKALQRFLSEKEIKLSHNFNEILSIGYEAYDLTYLKYNAPRLKSGLKLYPERYESGIRLFPWSHKNFGSCLVYRPEIFDKDIIKKMSPDYFALEIASVRDNTIRHIKRRYPKAQIALWFDQEPKPDDGYALLERLKNEIIGPHISYAMTKYPRALKSQLARHNLMGQKLTV